MYNLRSHKQNTIKLPVEIQLSDDSQFLQEFLAQNTVDFNEQINMSDSESDGSGSELNLSDIVQSDTEENDTVLASQENPGTSHKNSQLLLRINRIRMFKQSSMLRYWSN